jgi:hypothetical protein
VRVSLRDGKAPSLADEAEVERMVEQGRPRRSPLHVPRVTRDDNHIPLRSMDTLRFVAIAHDARGLFPNETLAPNWTDHERDTLLTDDDAALIYWRLDLTEVRAVLSGDAPPTGEWRMFFVQLDGWVDAAEGEMREAGLREEIGDEDASGAGTGDDGRRASAQPKDVFSFDDKLKTFSVNGVGHVIADDAAYLWLKVLASKPEQFITMREASTIEGELLGKRQYRMLKWIPPELVKHLYGSTAKGYRILPTPTGALPQTPHKGGQKMPKVARLKAGKTRR